MATGNTAQIGTTWSAIISRTAPAFDEEIIDGVSTNNALLWLLRRAGNIKVTEGARTFTHPIFYQEGSNFGMIGKFGTIPTNDDDDVTMSEWNIRIAAGSIVLSSFEQAQNQGKAQILNYLESKKKKAIIDFSQLLGRQVVTGDNTGNNMGGVEVLVSQVNTTTVGGIAGTGIVNSDSQDKPFLIKGKLGCRPFASMGAYSLN